MMRCRKAPRERYTHASVGRTFVSVGKAILPTVHPRERGTNAVITGEYLLFIGTPTRAWDERHEPPELRTHTRYTHASVGRTTPLISLTLLIPVHPRERGTNLNIGVGKFIEVGTPTRAWDEP